MNDLGKSSDHPRQAELIWARYDGKAGSKFYLIFYLGTHEKHAVGIIADLVPDHEIQVIRANLADLRTKDLKTIGVWIKKELPITYQNAYRHFESEKLFVIKNYGLNGLSAKS